MGKIFSLDEANSLMEYVVENNLCVFPEQQTISCIDCTICRIEYKRRLMCGEIEIKNDKN